GDWRRESGRDCAKYYGGDRFLPEPPQQTDVRIRKLFGLADITLPDYFIGNSGARRIRLGCMRFFFSRNSSASTTQGNNLAHDAESNFLWRRGRQVQTCWCPDTLNFFGGHAVCQQIVKNQSRAMCTGYKRNVSGFAFQRTL